MLHDVLTFIKDEVNTHFKLKFGTTSDKVVISPLFSANNGEPPAAVNDMLVMSLVNIEEEKVQNINPKYLRTKTGYSKLRPPLYLNLYVVFSAVFDNENYLEGIKMLSTLFGLFQVRYVFDADEYPALGGITEKISVEMVSMNLDQLNELWGPLASNYRPSVLYRLRSVIIQESQLDDDVSAIKSF